MAKWRITNTPKWEVLKDLLDQNFYGAVLNLSIHAVTSVGWLAWLVEIPLAWKWFLPTWSHGEVLPQYVRKMVASTNRPCLSSATEHTLRQRLRLQGLVIRQLMSQTS